MKFSQPLEKGKVLSLLHWDQNNHRRIETEQYTVPFPDMCLYYKKVMLGTFWLLIYFTKLYGMVLTGLKKTELVQKAKALTLKI